jgi:thioredoxin 1
MKNLWKVIIVLILVSAVAAVVVLKRTENKSQEPQVIISNSQTAVVEPNQANQPQKIAGDSNQLVMNIEAVEPKMLPRLVDLGADKCIPCKMMIPVLEELTKEYAGKLQVQFFDVWKSPVYAHQYGIRVIPTQIFLAPDGIELFRHEGYFSKEDILAKWKKLGFDLKKKD